MKQYQRCIGVFLLLAILLNVGFPALIAASQADDSGLVFDFTEDERKKLQSFTNALEKPETIKQAIEIGEKILIKPRWNNHMHLKVADWLISQYAKSGQIDRGERLYQQIIDYGNKHNIHMGKLLASARLSICYEHITRKNWGQVWKFIQHIDNMQEFIYFSSLVVQSYDMPYFREILTRSDFMLNNEININSTERFQLALIKIISLFHLGEKEAADKVFEEIDWDLLYSYSNDTRSWGDIDPPIHVILTMTIFELYNNIHDFDRAKILLTCVQRGVHQMSVFTLSLYMTMIAEYYRLTANYSEAEKIAFEIYDKLPSKIFNKEIKDKMLDDYLAGIYVSADRYDEAQSILSYRFEDSKRRLGPSHKETLDYFVQILEVSRILEDFERVKDLVAWYEYNEFMDKKQDSVYDLLFGRVYAFIGKHDIARRLLDKAAHMIDIESQNYNRIRNSLGGEKISYYYCLAEGYYKIGDKTKAQQWNEKCLKLIDALSARFIAPPKEKAMFVNNFKMGYSLQVKLLNETASIEQGFITLNTFKGRQLNEIMFQNSFENEQVLTPEQFSEITRLKDALRKHEIDAAIISDKIRKAEAEIDKVKAYQELGEYRKKLTRENPVYARKVKAEPQSSKAVAEVLSAGEVLADFWLDTDASVSFAYVISRDKELQAIPIRYDRKVEQSLKAFHLLLSYPPEQRQQIIECWELQGGGYKAILKNIEAAPPNGKRKVENPDEVAEYLGNIFIRPLLPHIGSAKSLIIAPDGALTSVPVEAFRLDSQYIIEEREVSYAYSSSLFYHLRRESGQSRLENRSLVAFGAPDFDPAQAASDPAMQRLTTRGAGQWKALTGARKEAENVTALFPGSRLYAGKEATKEKVYELSAKNMLNRSGAMLFATHGYYDHEDPLRSALVLQGNGDQLALLTAAEIAGLELPSKLVVLSACETGRGKVFTGAGIIGLPYAFFRAGAENTVITLWAVSDMATADIVSDYFVNLKEGQSFSQALTKAKRDMIRSADRNQPYYWAPLVMYGQ